MDEKQTTTFWFDFESAVAEGQYGAGVVRIWDRGTYTLERFDPDELKFTLFGTKLHGRYALIRMEKWPRDWLLLKLGDC